MNKLKILLLGSIVAFGMTGTAMSMDNFNQEQSSNKKIKPTVAFYIEQAKNMAQAEQQQEGADLFKKIGSAVKKEFIKILTSIHVDQNLSSKFEEARLASEGKQSVGQKNDQSGNQVKYNKAIEQFKERLQYGLNYLKNKEELDNANLILSEVEENVPTFGSLIGFTDINLPKNLKSLALNAKTNTNLLFEVAEKTFVVKYIELFGQFDIDESYLLDIRNRDVTNELKTIFKECLENVPGVNKESNAINLFSDFEGSDIYNALTAKYSGQYRDILRACFWKAVKNAETQVKDKEFSKIQGKFVKVANKQLLGNVQKPQMEMASSVVELQQRNSSLLSRLAEVQKDLEEMRAVNDMGEETAQGQLKSKIIELNKLKQLSGSGASPVGTDTQVQNNVKNVVQYIHQISAEKLTAAAFKEKILKDLLLVVAGRDNVMPKTEALFYGEAVQIVEQQEEQKEQKVDAFTNQISVNQQPGNNNFDGFFKKQSSTNQQQPSTNQQQPSTNQQQPSTNQQQPSTNNFDGFFKKKF